MAMLALIGVCATLIGAALVLQGCGGGGGSSNYVAHCLTAEATGGGCEVCELGFQPMGPQKQCFYKCATDLHFESVVASDKKGLMMDDITHQYCPERLHTHWANTNEPVKSIRIAKAWQSNWPDAHKQNSWKNIVRFLNVTGAKALVGTALSCNETSDDEDWADFLQLLKMIGRNNVMGVAIGNEVELLWNQGADKACLDRLWNGSYILNKFNQHVNDLDDLGHAWKDVKVTSIFGAYIFAGNLSKDESFVNDSTHALVLPFIQNVTKRHGDRYVFSLNNYPYFDEGLKLDKCPIEDRHTDECMHNHNYTTDKCFGSINHTTCFDSVNCSFNNYIHMMRQRMEEPNIGAKDNLLWITETGWSSPQAATLKWDPPNTSYRMANCSEFSALSSMSRFYESFLNWNLTISDADLRGPDHVFFFGMRDSSNFGDQEAFGLGGSGAVCGNASCKLQMPGAVVQTGTGLVV